MEERETKAFLYRGLIFGLLFATWVIFSGLLDAFHLALGVISCVIVAWLSSDLLFENRSLGFGRRLREGVRLVAYLLWLLWQIVMSNLHLLRLAFSNLDELQPQILRYETNLKSDFEKFLLANSITLTPGTVTMKIIGGTFYVHAISDVTARGLGDEMETRIARIFAESPPQSSPAPTR